MPHVLLNSLLVDVEALVRDSGILSAVVLKHLVAPRVPSAPVSHVVNIAVNDDPKIAILIVLSHFLSRQKRKRAATELRNGRRHLLATVTSPERQKARVTLATPLT